MALILFAMAALVVGIKSMIGAWTWELPWAILLFFGAIGFFFGWVLLIVLFRASIAEFREGDDETED